MTLSGKQWQPVGPAILFVPADKPERYVKAVERSDMVIVDLEDGCRPERRAQARESILAADLDPRRTIIRINSADSDDYAADMDMLDQSSFRTVMVPKAESSTAIEAVGDYQVIALIETPAGVLHTADVAAAKNVVGLFWGAEDLIAGFGGTSSRFQQDEDLSSGGAPGIVAGRYRDVARYARAQVHVAAAAYGKVALDSVHVDIKDEIGLRAEAKDAAALGYSATVCIHPNQVPIIREAYRPTNEQLDWARRLLAEAGHNQGAFSFEGRMVDVPLFRQAEAIARRGGQ